ncbi:MAG TPA: calcium-binding protein [Rhizobiaceae bacterium]|nr:calcium-binding protein [Rhizobiaceae bacterium]
MTAHIFTTNFVSSGHIAVMANDFDTAYVAPGITVGSTDADVIRGTGDGYNVIVAGRVVADGTGVRLGVNGSTSNSHTATIRVGAEVVGATAVSLSSYDVRFENAGLIYGTGYGIYVSGNNTSTTSTITNSGRIEGVYAIGGNLEERLTLTNSGTIKGEIYSFGGGSLVDRVTNTGLMVGTVGLNTGDDLYDGRLGRVVGTVNGHDGKDTILGGKEANTFSGGSGSDIINGGFGIDKLTGGGGNDFFVFNVKVAAANRDVIDDFNANGNDTMRLENAMFTKIGAVGVLKAAAFKLSTQTKDADDRIIYNKATGQVFYDADGSGAVAPVLFATLTNEPTLTRFDFQVI